MNVRNAVTIIVLRVVFASFVSLAFLPIPVSVTLASGGETWSPSTAEMIKHSTTTTILSLIFEPYTQTMTTTEILAAFQGLAHNEISLALLCILPGSVLYGFHYGAYMQRQIWGMANRVRYQSAMYVDQGFDFHFIA